MTIRRAAEKDIPKIMDLLLQVNNVHAKGRPDIFVADRTKYTPGQLDALLSDPATPIFVGVDGNDAVVGYAFCRFEQSGGTANMRPSRDLYVDDICLDAPARGKGLAREIFDAVERFARAEGCDRITLHVWECNPGARRFYEKCGMAPYFHAMEKRLGK